MEIPNNPHMGSLKFQNVEDHQKEQIKNEEQMQKFMKEVSEKLKQSKPLNNLFLKDGTLINSLSEIPQNEQILFASRSPFFRGFRKVVTRQNPKRIRKDSKCATMTNLHSEGLLNPEKQYKVTFNFEISYPNR